MDKAYKQYKGPDGCIYFFDIDRKIFRKICDVPNPKDLPDVVYKEIVRDINAAKDLIKIEKLFVETWGI